MYKSTAHLHHFALPAPFLHNADVSVLVNAIFKRFDTIIKVVEFIWQLVEVVIPTEKGGYVNVK